MSKRNNVAFVKPDEPSFIKRIKQQIGYKEGPTVDTKREISGPSNFNDDDEVDDQPTIVVLGVGDLTAEEFEVERNKQAKENESTPADLSQRIVFCPSTKSKNRSVKSKEAGEKLSKNTSKNTKVSPVNSKIVKSNLLSFNEDEQEEY